MSRQVRARLDAIGIQRTMRTTAAVALLASLASPTPALAPESHRPHYARSHGPAAAHVWPAAASIYDEVAARAHGLDAAAQKRIARTILGEAARTGLDPLLVVAVIQVESGFRARTVSSAGAVGLMQLLGSTMREVARRTRLPSADPRDPIANVQAGMRYLAMLMQTFGDAELALMAYNAGPGRIGRYMRAGEIPRRFWGYPRNVDGELHRLGGAIAMYHRPDRSRLASILRPANTTRIALAAAHGEFRIARSEGPNANAAAQRLAAPIAQGIAAFPKIAVAGLPIVHATDIEPVAAAASGQFRDGRGAPRPVEPERGVPPGLAAARVNPMQWLRAAA